MSGNAKVYHLSSKPYTLSSCFKGADLLGLLVFRAGQGQCFFLKKNMIYNTIHVQHALQEGKIKRILEFLNAPTKMDTRDLQEQVCAYAPMHLHFQRICRLQVCSHLMPGTYSTGKPGLAWSVQRLLPKAADPI